jgi:predicted deacylase
LEPNQLKGTLIALPVVNLLAWEAKQRVSPLDHIDLNRVFPGAHGQTHTRRLAHALFSEIRANADYLIDLHGSRSSHFALYLEGSAAASREAERLAMASGAPVVAGVKERWLDESLFAVSTREGIPAILIEAPGEGRADEALIDYFVRCLQNVGVELEMLAGVKEARDLPARVRTLVPLPAPNGGFVDLHVRRGERVVQGQLIARILSAWGDPLSEITVPMREGIILNLDTHGVILAGEPLVMIGEP